MATYIIFARWFGIISVLLALGILFNLDDARKMAKNMVNSETGYIMGGVQPIIFGTLAFTLNHSFTVDWQLLVTIIGMLMMLVGAYRVLFVDHWKKVMKQNIDKIPTLFSLFGLMLGLLLLYVGYIVPLLEFNVNYQ